MIVRELLNRIGFVVNEASLRQAEGSVNRVKDAADNAARSFQALFAGFVGFSAIKSISKTADDMQSLEARVAQLPQTVGDTAEAFDTVAKHADASRQSIDAYANFYIKLQNAGKDFIKTQEEGLQVTDTITKALVVGGATAQEQSSALLQFGQAIGSGVLQGDELRALSEAAPQFLDSLAKAIGIPRMELKKFASEGKLTSKAVIEGVKKISSEFDERFRNMPMTIGQSTTIIKNRWDVFINNLNRKSGAVTKIADLFLKGFDRIEKGLSDMVKFFGGATNTLKFFGLALAAALSPFVFRAATGAIATLLSPIGLLVTALLGLLLVGEDFYQWMNGGKSVFGKWFGNFDKAMEKLNEFSGTITALKIVVLSAFGVMIAEWIYAGVVATITAARSAMAWITSLAQFGVALVANTVAVGAWVVSLLAEVAVAAAGWISAFVSMAIAAAPVLLPMLAIIAAVTAIVAAIFFLLDNWKTVFSLLYNIATFNFDGVAKDFLALIDKMKGYWSSVKGLFGFNTTTPNAQNSTSTIATQNTVTPATVAGAAASPSGVPSAGFSSNTTTMTVNQTLPPGTPQQTAEAARSATMQALDPIARQMGQLQ